MRNFIELTCFMGFPQQQEKKFPGVAKGMQAVQVTVHKVDVDCAAVKILESVEGQPFRTILIFHDKDSITVMEDRETVRKLMRDCYRNGPDPQECYFIAPAEVPAAE